MQTRKHPRTLNEAFGPYAGNVITETDPPSDWQDATVIVCGILCLMGVGFFALAGWLA